MIGCANHQFRPFKTITQGVIHLDGIVFLRFVVIVIVVVVEDIDFCRQLVLLESGRQLLDKRCFLVPRHVERGTVSLVQRFVLRTHGIDINTLGLHGLYKLDEVFGIGLAIVRVQMPVSPRIKGSLGLQIFHLHPFRASPRSGDDLHLGIDGQNLLDDGNHIVGLIPVELEVFKSLRVAKRVFGARKVIAADRDAGIAHPVAFRLRISLLEKMSTSLRRHLQQVVTSGISEGEAEAVHTLILLCRIHLNGGRRHRLPCNQGGTPLSEHGETVGCGCKNTRLT